MIWSLSFRVKVLYFWQSNLETHKSKAQRGRQVAKVVELGNQENKLGDLAKRWSGINNKQTEIKLVQVANQREIKTYILQLHPAFRGSDKT
jgi:hypothetical protein